MAAYFDRWHSLIQENAPFHARLEQARLEEYFEEVQRLVGIELL